MIIKNEQVNMTRKPGDQSRDELLRRAVKTYGKTAQNDMMIEEMSELTKAVMKLRRAPLGAKWRHAVECVLEEMADVQIMLDQMKIMYGDPLEIENAKLARLADRLEKNTGGKRP